MRRIIFALLFSICLNGNANIVAFQVDSLTQPVQSATISGCDTLEIIDNMINSVSLYTDTGQYGVPDWHTEISSDTVIGPYSPNPALGVMYLYNLTSFTKMFVGHQVSHTYFDLSITACPTASIEPFGKYLKTKIFPNPTEEKFLIESEQEIESIEIYNLLGAIVGTEIVKKKTAEVDVHELESGNYLAVLKTNSGYSIFEKFVKQ